MRILGVCARHVAKFKPDYIQGLANEEVLQRKDAFTFRLNVASAIASLLFHVGHIVLRPERYSAEALFGTDGEEDSATKTTQLEVCATVWTVAFLLRFILLTLTTIHRPVYKLFLPIQLVMNLAYELSYARNQISESDVILMVLALFLSPVGYFSTFRNASLCTLPSSLAFLLYALPLHMDYPLDAEKVIIAVAVILMQQLMLFAFDYLLVYHYWGSTKLTLQN